MHIRQPMLCQNNDVLHLRHHLHIDAAIDVLARGGQTLTVADGGQHHRIGRDRTFNAVHPQRYPQSGR
ncbi:hypothetical protein D3C71_1851290 [compost metagenome]